MDWRERKQRDGKPVLSYGVPVLSHALFSIAIPVLNTQQTINVDVWEEKRETPDGTETSFSFSLPRTIQHTYQFYVKGTKDYAEALHVFNAWKGAVINRGIELHEKRISEHSNGQVTRLVKRAAALPANQQ